MTTCGTRSRYLAGAWRSNMSGGSTTWSSMLTRIRSSTFICIPLRCASPHRNPTRRRSPPRSSYSPRSTAVSAEEATGRPAFSARFTASATSSSLATARPFVVLEADAEVATALQGERGELGGEEVVAEDGHRPRQRAAVEHLEVRVERRLGRRQAEPEAARGLDRGAAEVEAQHRAGRELAGAPVRQRGAQEPGLEDRHAGHEVVTFAERALVLDVAPGVHVGEAGAEVDRPGIDHADAQTDGLGQGRDVRVPLLDGTDPVDRRVEQRVRSAARAPAPTPRGTAPPPRVPHRTCRCGCARPRRRRRSTRARCRRSRAGGAARPGSPR